MDGATRKNLQWVGAMSDLDYRPVGLGDFDADNKVDILWRNVRTGDLIIWYMNGASKATSRGIGQIDVNYEAPVVGDINGDRRADIFFRHKVTGDNIAFIVNANGSLSGAVYANLPPQWHAGGIGDFNGDRRDDLVWQDRTTGEVRLWLFNSDWWTRTEVSVGTFPDLSFRIAGVGDYNGGGPDILFFNPATAVSKVWYMNGTALTSERDLGGYYPGYEVPGHGGTGTWSLGTYQYDGSGNIMSQGQDIRRYDKVGRIVVASADQAQGGYHRQEYTYDTFGNITKIDTIVNGSSTTYPGSSISIQVDQATNHIVEVGGTGGYIYDQAGNLTSWPGGGAKYDGLMLHQSVTPTNGIEQIYTAGDERLASVKGVWDSGHMTWTTFSWNWTVRDLANKVVREFTSSGGTLGLGSWVWKEDYVYRDGALLAGESPSGTKYFHLDHLGSVRLVTEQYRNDAVPHDYYAFGQESSPMTRDSEPMKFAGHERDYNGGTLTENVGYLDYMHARYYSPAWGRFLSVDPVLDAKKALTEPQHWNRYAYVTNNPLGKTDPDGRVENVQMPGFTKSLSEADWSDAPPEIRAAFMIEGTLALSAAGEGINSIFGALRVAATVERSIENPVSFTGAKPEEVREAIPESWGPGVASRKDGGTRWQNPTKRGEGVRIMSGTAGARDPMHAGPYAIFTRNGQKIRVPLEANPALGQSFWRKVIDAVKDIVK